MLLNHSLDVEFAGCMLAFVVIWTRVTKSSTRNVYNCVSDPDYAIAFVYDYLRICLTTYTHMLSE